MESSPLLKQVDRLKAQLKDEKDWVTRWEMRRTIHHLYKQFRQTTTHRKPWYGFRSNIFYLVLIFLAVIGFLALLVSKLGFLNILGACFLTILVLVLLTAMVFLLMKIFSPAQYERVVGKVLTNIQQMWTHSAPKNINELHASQDEENGE